MALADDFQGVIDSLPPDWTQLEMDLRIADEDRYIDAASLLVQVVEHASVEERTDQGLIKEKLRVELRRFIRKRSGRRPLVVPVIMEI